MKIVVRYSPLTEAFWARAILPDGTESREEAGDTEARAIVNVIEDWTHILDIEIVREES
jgi:hypothetical protein